MAADLATLVLAVDSTQVKTGNEALSVLTARAGGAEKSVNTLTSSMRGLATVANLVIGALSVRELVEVTREFDRINAGLITVTGSADSAAEQFSAIQQFAAKTPFDLAQVSQAFIQLSNFGLASSERALTSYGNTASSMGKSLNQMVEAVADAATGEFERLKEFGIRSQVEGNKVVFTFKGVSTEVGKSAKEIEEHLIKLGENNFAGAMEQRMATLDGAISNLGDAWDSFLLKVSQAGAGEVLESGVRGATEALTELGNRVDLVVESITFLGAAVAGALAGRMIQASLAMAATAAQALTTKVAVDALGMAVARTTAGTVAMGVAGRVAASTVGALGGPIGIVTTALTLGVTAWSLWGDGAETAAKKASKALQEVQEEVLRTGATELEVAQARLDAARTKYYETGMKASSPEREEFAKYESLVQQLEAREARLTARMKKGATEQVGSSDWGKLYLSEAQKRVAALAELDEVYAKETQRFAGNQEQQLRLATEYHRKRAQLEEQFRGKSGSTEFEKATNQQEEAYKRLTRGIEETVIALQLEQAGYKDLTQGQQTALKFVTDLTTGQLSLTNAQKQVISTQLNQQIELEKTNKALEEHAQLIKAIRQPVVNAEDASLDLNEAQKALLATMRSPVWAQFSDQMQQIAVDEVAAATNALEAAEIRKQINELLQSTPTAQLEKQRALMQALAQDYLDQKFGIVGSTEAMTKYGEVVQTALGTVHGLVEGTTDEMTEFARQAARNIQDAFADFLFDPFSDGLDGMLRQFGVMLQKMIAQAVAADLSNRIFGQGFASGQSSSIGGWLGSALSIAGMVSGGMSFGNAAATVSANAAGGGLDSLISATGGWGTLPSFDVGTDYVPRDMLAMIHKGERIVPAAQNKRSTFAETTNNINVNVALTNGNQAEARRAGAQIAREVNAALNKVSRYS